MKGTLAGIEKIKILQDIKDGKLSISDLRPPELCKDVTKIETGGNRHRNRCCIRRCNFL